MPCIVYSVWHTVLPGDTVSPGWAEGVDCRCFLSFVFLDDASRLELSPCKTVLSEARAQNTAMLTGSACTSNVASPHITWLWLMVSVMSRAALSRPPWPCPT